MWYDSFVDHDSIPEIFLRRQASILAWKCFRSEPHCLFYCQRRGRSLQRCSETSCLSVYVLLLLQSSVNFSIQLLHHSGAGVLCDGLCLHFCHPPGASSCTVGKSSLITNVKRLMHLSSWFRRWPWVKRMRSYLIANDFSRCDRRPSIRHSFLKWCLMVQCAVFLPVIATLIVSSKRTGFLHIMSYLSYAKYALEAYILSNAARSVSSFFLPPTFLSIVISWCPVATVFNEWITLIWWILLLAMLF